LKNKKFIMFSSSTLFLILILTIGLCVGSFLNVLIYRLPREISFIKGRSFCPKCKKKISWFDNIPLFSYLRLGGKCRYCRSFISLRYPIVEVLSSILFLLTFNQIGLNLINLILSFVLISGLLIVFFIDLEHQIIPDCVIFPLAILFLLFFLFTGCRLLVINNLISAIGASLFLFLIWIATKGKGMGMGDVKLAFLLGLVLGFPKTLVAVYFAFLTGAIVGIILILVKKAKFGQKIPFGPFLSAATIVTYLWGERIISLARKIIF